MPPTIFWYDLETTGTDPINDRPVQFAGVRTDLELNQIEPAVSIFCAPGDDVIPSPEAIQVTGLSMLKLKDEGLCETDFCTSVLSHLMVPATCTAGFNSIRFDDEFTRQMCYRNLRDPYQREWRDGNSRWDIIDGVRMAAALRPDGVTWPLDADGVPVYRLEAIAEANGIRQGDAHEALSDVMATIDLARCLRRAQPRLYAYLFALRDKKQVLRGLYPLGKSPLVHVSSMYSSKRFCTTVVLPICTHPTNSNGIICYDLTVDPRTLLDASSDEIARLVFSRSDELAEDDVRIPLKTIHVNRCPAIAPINTMDGACARRLDIDIDRCEANMRAIQTSAGMVSKIQAAFDARGFPQSDDPDRMLYQGGFFTDADREQMAAVHHCAPDQLATFTGKFADQRLDEMLFRFRARNYPGSLSADEQARWNEFRRHRWVGGELTAAKSRLDELLSSDPDQPALIDLKAYLETVTAGVAL
ncbi:MAG: exodeoxyribonuclease I [Proteobacteria bacterium]|nr:exodeoxyribonuclease I [Pseudomonadota bacterium]